MTSTVEPLVAVVTTDLFPELVEWIRAGKVAATVYQRPVSQGRMALQALYQFLVNGVRPPSRLRVVPHLVMRSNLDLFLERLRLDLEEAPDAAPDDVASARRPVPPAIGTRATKKARRPRAARPSDRR
jgi:ABC-type sugar transport system substrate-binding protein